MTAEAHGRLNVAPQLDLLVTTALRGRIAKKIDPKIAGTSRFNCKSALLGDGNPERYTKPWTQEAEEVVNGEFLTSGDARDLPPALTLPRQLKQGWDAFAEESRSPSADHDPNRRIIREGTLRRRYE